MTVNTLNLTFRNPWSPQFSIGMFLVRCCRDNIRTSKSRSYCRAAILTLLLVGWSVVSTVCGGAQLITIEPEVQYNVSGRDDIKLMRQFFREASWESPISSGTWRMLKPLGVSKTRLINVESRKSIIINPSTKELVFDFAIPNLVKALKNCKTYSLIPHIIVGQFPQDALTVGKKNGKYYGISDWTSYEKYAHAFLEFVMLKNGFSQADFEVGNEPDIGDLSWLLKDNVGNGHPEMYSAYLKLYRAWANAADKLAREHPELKLRIGGPNITIYSYAPGKLNWAGQFLEDIVAQGLRLDFISFHYYGNYQALPGLAEFGRYPSLSKQIDYLRDKLKTTGLNDIPMYITEWGPSYEIKETPKGIVNSNHVGAAWMARFLLNMAENNIDEGSFLLFRDKNHRDKPTNNWGWPGLLMSDGITPKALYNVALMFTKLPGQRVNSIPTRQGPLGTIASADTSKVGILVFNQNWDFPNSKELATKEEVQLQINGLPFTAPNVEVVRYVVDETYSNAYYLYKNKVKPTPRNAALRKVEIKTIPVVNGKVNLPNVYLEPSSVTLWEITASK